MTETLKHALHERADAVRFDAPDLAAIRAGGDRTLRRRRAGVLGGGLVAAGLVVGVATVVVTSGPAARDGAVATDPGPVGSTAVVSWVEGSTLHRSSGDQIDLGREAVAFVRTSEGYVFADVEGVVRAVTTAGRGGVTEVGRTEPDAVRLVSDPEGSRAAWLAPDGAVVVHDQATGADLAVLDRFTDAEPALTAMDGDTVYVAVGEEARSLDLSTGDVSPVAADGSEVLSAAADLLVLGNDDGMRLLRPDRSTTVLRDDFGDVGTLSPDGAWFSSDADDPRVVSTATGERPTFDVPAFFATGYEWLDASTVVMITQESGTAPVRLLTCRVPSGACERAAELGTFDELSEQGFVLPVGVPTDD